MKEELFRSDSDQAIEAIETWKPDDWTSLTDLANYWAYLDVHQGSSVIRLSLQLNNEYEKKRRWRNTEVKS
jgi:hypothetical protein